MEKRLLIVDREGTLADAAREALSPEWLPTYVGDPEQALIIARIKVPDLVLCPVSLGGMDGYEFGRRLRGQPQTHEIPLVLAGVYVNRLELEEIPGSFVMTLPQSPEDFNLALEKALSNEEAEVVEDFDTLFEAALKEEAGAEAPAGQPFELGDELVVAGEEAEDALVLGEEGELAVEVTADLLESLPEVEEEGEEIELSPALPEDEESALALEVLSEFAVEAESTEEAAELSPAPETLLSEEVLSEEDTLTEEFLSSLKALEEEETVVEVSEEEAAEGLELLESLELPVDDGSLALPVADESTAEAEALEPFESLEAECEETCVAVQLAESLATVEVELSCEEDACPLELAEEEPAAAPEFPPAGAELPAAPLSGEEVEVMGVLEELGDLESLELSVAALTPADEEVPAALGIEEDLPEAVLEVSPLLFGAGLLPETGAEARDEALATNVDLLEELTVEPAHEPEPIFPNGLNHHPAAPEVDYFATEAARQALAQAVSGALSEEALKELITAKVNEIVWKVVPPLAEKLLLEAIEKTRTMPED